VKLPPRLMLLILLLPSVAGLAFSQSGSQRATGGPAVVGCSPAPCVLPPTLATGDEMPNYDAPIVANPAKPQQILVGSFDVNCFQESSLGFHLSSDGGSVWSDFCLPPTFFGGIEYITDFGPILGYDHNGVAYVGGPYYSTDEHVHLAFEGFSKSSDGMSWTAPAVAAGRRDWAIDSCWMSVDTSVTSLYLNSVYVACVLLGPIGNEYMNQIVVSHSNDSGATWHQVNVAPVQDAPDGLLYPNMTVGKDGTLYLTWEFCNSQPTCETNNVSMYFSTSTDGGGSWSAPALVATVTIVPGYMIPNTGVYAIDPPVIAVDNSNGPYAGNLYVVMYNWTGTFMQLEVARSTDRGNTWSKPVPVAPGITHDQFFPWLSVSPNGLVSASWLDRRNDPNNIDYQAFAGFSADGGLSFQPNVQLTTGFSNPNNKTDYAIGSYTGNTWDGPNYFLAAWMDNSQTMYIQDVVGGIRLK
jgi:hypothetical protein